MRTVLEAINTFLSGLPERWLFLFVFSFLLSFLLTPLVRYIAVRFKVLDVPNGRKIHKQPIPLLGGLAIYVSYIITLFLNFSFSRQLKGIVLGGTIIMIMGIVDDIKHVPASSKLIIQVLAALILIGYGVRLDFLPNSWWGRAGEIILTSVWLVGITNAVNFFDGMDGLAAGLAAICSLSFFVIAHLTGQAYLGFLTIALAGSSLGFIRYNFKPASVFLGDGGSTFLGFTLAGLAVMGEWAEHNPKVALTLPILILSVFVFDMVYITISRILTGTVRNFRDWIEYTGKDHLHHRLVSIGFNEIQSVVLIYLIAACLGIGGITLIASLELRTYFVLIQAILMLIIIVVLMLGSHALNGKK